MPSCKTPCAAPLSPVLAEHFSWLLESLGWACAEDMLSLLEGASLAGQNLQFQRSGYDMSVPRFSPGEGVQHQAGGAAALGRR